MPLEIEPKIGSQLPLIVKKALSEMSTEDQLMFQKEFTRKAKSVGGMVALAIFFPIQLFLLGKTGLGIAFLLTAGGAGMWYIIEWFLTPKRVKEYNEELAVEIMRDIKIMSK